MRKPIGTTALASGVWGEGPYLSLHHGQVRRRGVSISVPRSVVFFELSDGKKGKVHFVVALGIGPVVFLLLLLGIDPVVFCCKASALGVAGNHVFGNFTDPTARWKSGEVCYSIYVA